MSGYADNPQATHDYPEIQRDFNIEIPARLESKLNPQQLKKLEDDLVHKEHDSRKHIVKARRLRARLT